MTRDSFVIVGLGSIGRRHLQNLRTLVPDAIIGVVRRIVPHQQGEPLPEGADAIFGSIDEALKMKPSGAIICSPATMHFEDAQLFAKAGCGLLVEKPLAAERGKAARLVRMCDDHLAPLVVGYNFRFSTAARRFERALADGGMGDLLHVQIETGQYLPDWRPGTDHRQSISARKETGGGVVLELSHELDLIGWFFGRAARVCAHQRNSRSLGIEVCDTVDAIIELQSGQNVNLHLDFLQRDPFRQVKVVGSEATLLWDMLESTIDLISNEGRTSISIPEGSRDRNQMYVEEMRHFLACVAGEEKPLVSGTDGLAALALAEAIIISSSQEKWVRPAL